MYYTSQLLANCPSPIVPHTVEVILELASWRTRVLLLRPQELAQNVAVKMGNEEQIGCYEGMLFASFFTIAGTLTQIFLLRPDF